MLSQDAMSGWTRKRCIHPGKHVCGVIFRKRLVLYICYWKMSNKCRNDCFWARTSSSTSDPDGNGKSGSFIYFLACTFARIVHFGYKMLVWEPLIHHDVCILVEDNKCGKNFKQVPVLTWRIGFLSVQPRGDMPGNARQNPSTIKLWSTFQSWTT